MAAKITGIGGYLPAREVTNFDLEKMLDTTDEWIVQRTGIRKRHWAAPSQATSDLALEASLIAIKQAGIDVKEIDLLVFATSSPDTDIPGSAAFLQAKLGLSGIPYFDIRQGCSGFIYGLSLAEKYISSGSHKCALIVGAEIQSKGLDLTPRGKAVSIIFGDGAGAVILQSTEVKDPARDPHILRTVLHADGQFAKELWMPGPGSAMGPERLTHKMIDDGLVYPEMNGRLVFSHAVTRMPEVLGEVLAAASLKLPDVDMFFFHQANARINEKVACDFNIDREKVYSSIERFGNTTAATIPLGMWDAQQAGKLKPGMLMALTSFGAGFTWASSLVRF